MTPLETQEYRESEKAALNALQKWAWSIREDCNGLIDDAKIAHEEMAARTLDYDQLLDMLTSGEFSFDADTCEFDHSPSTIEALEAVHHKGRFLTSRLVELYRDQAIARLEDGAAWRLDFGDIIITEKGA